MQASAARQDPVEAAHVPLVSEAVVDVAEEGPMQQIPKGKSGEGISYVIPIVFCGIAIGLILAAILSGVDLTL